MELADVPPEVYKLTQQLEHEKYEALASRYETLRKENDVMKSRLLKSEQDTHDFVAYFQKELQGKDLRIQKLNEMIGQSDVERKREREKLLKDQKDQVEALECSLANTESALATKVKTLEDELAKVEAFREMKRNMETRIESLETQLKEKTETLMQEQTSNERKFLMEKSKIQKEMAAKIDDVRKQAKDEMRNGFFDADTLKIIAENKRMTEELKFQHQTTKELQCDKIKIEDEVKVVKRDVELAEDKVTECCRQMRGLKTKNSKLEAKVTSMTTLLDATKQDHATAQKKATASLEKNLEQQTLDAASLRQIVRVKNRELRKIRRLAHIVLEQRTDVEQFFLDALADVKEKIRDKRRAEYRHSVAEYRAQIKEATSPTKNNGMKAQFPKIRALQAGKNMDNFSFLDPDAVRTLPRLKTKVYLKDLSLEDREHVLRLLFAKINAVYGSLPTLPPHDLEENNHIGFATTERDRTFVTNGANSPGDVEHQFDFASGVTFNPENTSSSEYPS